MSRDYLKILETVLGSPKSITGFEHNYDCPFCERRGHTLHVNYEKNKALCHTCGYGAKKVINIYYKLTGYRESSVAQLKIFKKLLRREVPSLLYKQVCSLLETQENSTIEKAQLPKSFRPIMPKMSHPLGLVIKDYLTNRGITIEQIMESGIGYARKGKYEGMAVFPNFQNGVVDYFTARNVLHPWWSDKSRNPKVDKRNYLFNYDNCIQNDVIKYLVITEGVSDCLAVDRAFKNESRGVCIYGKRISTEQANLLEMIPCKKIVLCLDADVSEKEIMVNVNIIKRAIGTDVNIARLEEGDPDDASPRDLRRCVKKSVPYTFFNQIEDIFIE